VTHVFTFIGEEESKVGDESRSYLGEHIFKQVFSIYATEEEKRERAGKRDRKVFSKLGEEVRGSKLQVDQHSQWSTGQNSFPLGGNTLSRIEDGDGPTESETRTGF